MQSETSHAVQPSVFAFGMLPAQFAHLMSPFYKLFLEYRRFQH